MNFIRQALDEAVFSIGISRPNPAVGAVVVKDGIVVGKGRTQRPGSAHAEVMALRDAGELARGAAIYVTLEPCCHYGRTPPCTKAIIDAGIKKVFYAHADPNPVVRGNSRRILEEAGIEVYEGLDACMAAFAEAGWDDHCASGGECCCLMSNADAVSSAGDAIPSAAAVNVIPGLNRDLASFSKAFIAEGRYVFHDVERYFEAYDYFVRNKRTFVEIKCAVSQEGYMGAVAADGCHCPVKITGDSANCWNHELRAISDAVLVGAGTLLADNPSLNVRLVAGNDPVKIVWAVHHEFTAGEVAGLRVFSHPEKSDAPCFCEQKTHGEGAVNVLVFSCVPQPALGCCDVILLSGTTFAENWMLMLDELARRGMHRLMVEPGATLAKQLFESQSPRSGDKLWNRLNVWRSTDCRVDDALTAEIASGSLKNGLEFPELPRDVVAKESFMAGPDVLTVYYPT